MQPQLVFVDLKKKKTDSECGSCEDYFQLVDKKDKKYDLAQVWKLLSIYLCSLEK